MDIEIPYNVEERKDTGLYNSKLGIWLFLASEVMLFGGLFSAYILLRTGDPLFMINQHHLSVPMAALNTAILITSSVTMVMAWVSLKLDDLKLDFIDDTPKNYTVRVVDTLRKKEESV